MAGKASNLKTNMDAIPRVVYWATFVICVEEREVKKSKGQGILSGEVSMRWG